MSECPIVRVVPRLQHGWEIEVNPDGTRTLLMRAGELLTEGAANMINDIHAERAASWPHVGRCIQWGPPQPGRTVLIVKLVRELTENGQRVLIASNDYSGLRKIVEELFGPPDPQEADPPDNASCA